MDNLDVKVKQHQSQRTAQGLFDEGLSKGTNTKVKDLTLSSWYLFAPQLSCFSPNAAIPPLIRAVHFIDISYICIVTQRSIELGSEYKNTNFFLMREKKTLFTVLLNLTELQNSLERVGAMVFIQAESLQDGNMFGAHFPSLLSQLELTYCFSSSRPDRTLSKTALSSTWKTWNSCRAEINW